MISEQTILAIIQILTLIIGGSAAGVSIQQGRKVKSWKDQAEENSQLAEHFEKRLSEANEARIEQADRIRELDAFGKAQQQIVNQLTAKLEVLTGEFERQRRIYQEERDEIMQDKGAADEYRRRTEQDIEKLRLEVAELRSDKVALQQKNSELEAANRDLLTYKQNCERLTAEKADLERRLQICQDTRRNLEARNAALEKAADKGGAA